MPATIKPQSAVRRATNLLTAALVGDFNKTDYDWANRVLARDQEDLADPRLEVYERIIHEARYNLFKLSDLRAEHRTLTPRLVWHFASVLNRWEQATCEARVFNEVELETILFALRQERVRHEAQWDDEDDEDAHFVLETHVRHINELIDTLIVNSMVPTDNLQRRILLAALRAYGPAATSTGKLQ
jgi:hypothetical protein